MTKAMLGWGIITLLTSFNVYAHETLNIYNNSSYVLTKQQEVQHQMIDWNFPSVIPLHSYAYTHFTFDYGIFSSPLNDVGDVYYQTTCANGQLETIHLKADIYSYKSGLSKEYYSRLTTDSAGGNCVSLSPNEKTFTHEVDITFSNNT